ncbi:MAG: Lrp/AsnC ligand binding domain-containing protein, partial [Victivallales bacterium]|nr:Lrp/AsnC ligand binding domain-containing protein [Victivallales bacterium]
IAERLGKFPEVRSVYLVSGRYDLRLEVVGSSLQEIASFVAAKLSCQNGVKSTATYFMLKKYKEAGITLNGGGEENERLKIVP